MFGRRAQLPLDLVFKTDVSPAMTTPEYAVELKQSLEAAYEKVRQTTGAKQKVQRRLYNRRVHGYIGWRSRLATYYGTVESEYQEVASSMYWPISCHQEAAR